MSYLPVNQIVQGDALEILRTFPDESVHCVVTSPPYWGLRDYGLPPTVWEVTEGTVAHHETGARCLPMSDAHQWGETVPGSNRGGSGTPTNKNNRGEGYSRAAPRGQFCSLCGAWKGCLGLEPTPELFVQHLVAVFREAHRVLRKDGTLWLNLGDSYWSDTLSRKDPVESMWGNRPASDLSAGRNNIPKSNARGGLGARPPGIKPKDLCGIPWRVAFALQADGWYLRSDIIWQKPNPMPEPVKDRPTKAHEYVFLMAKSKKYFYDYVAVKEPLAAKTLTHRGKGKCGKKGQQDALGKVASGNWSGTPRQVDLSGRNRRTVWTITTKPFKDAHFAIFPEQLVEPCIKAGTSERGCCSQCGAPLHREIKKNHTTAAGKSKIRPYANQTGDGVETHDIQHSVFSRTETVGWNPSCKCDSGTKSCVVLDPFAGSGTTALVSLKLKRQFVGIELNPEYREIALKRFQKYLYSKHNEK